MAHSWRFFRAGGVDQVQLTRGADLANLGELDQKLWVALACPVEGLEIDARSLRLIDTDGDSRVRARELIEAAKWTTGLLKDPDSLTKGTTAVALDNVDQSKPEGKALVATAKLLLAAEGKAGASEIGTADIDNAVTIFGKQAFNGDGVVTASAARDDATQKAIAEIVAATEAPRDRNGEAGVSVESLAAFQAELTPYVEWLDRGRAEGLLPLGDATEAGYAAFSAVRDKVNDYFSRTRVAAYDTRALEGLNREQSEYTAIGTKPLSESAEEIAHFPLARIEAGRPLPLQGFVNPAWSGKLDALQKQAVTPMLGARAAITGDDWHQLSSRFAQHGAWLAEKPASKAAALSPERARELQSPDLARRIQELLAEDEAEKPKFLALANLEKLVYLHRDLFEVANNFVAFRGFYGRTSKAAFQFGTLFIDQRECELVIRVNDPAKHALLSPLSKCYLLYCDIRNAKGEKAQIVAGLTSGESENLMIGRNGVFYDRAGNDWDATVSKIVESPISLKGAFWAPYKKVLRTIEEFVAKRAAAAEANSNAKLDAGIAHAQVAVDGAPKPATPAPAPAPSKFDIGVIAALGVAVGGITAALGALLQSFFGLGIWMPLGILGLLLLISGPSMAVTWLKLRQRNLGPLLDANGWAVNTKAKLNVAFGESLTKLPRLPAGATRDLTDPFAEKKRPWGFYFFCVVFMALLLTWYLGKLDRFLPARVQSVEVLGDGAPAKVQTVPEAK